MKEKYAEKPSEFLTLGFPTCSIFGETWHEISAMAYINALAALGDTWKHLTPAECKSALKGTPQEGEYHSALMDTERMEKVIGVLRNAEDARKFSWAWNRELK